MSKNILKGMMIKMKKAILCILMCLVLMLSFAACKNKDGSSDTTAPDTTVLIQPTPRPPIQPRPPSP